MQEFLGHPLWAFIGTIAGLLSLWITWLQLPASKKRPLKEILKGINNWAIALLAVAAFIAGNVAGQNASPVFSPFIINSLTMVLSFALTVGFLLFGIFLKRRILVNKK